MILELYVSAMQLIAGQENLQCRLVYQGKFSHFHIAHMIFDTSKLQKAPFIALVDEAKSLEGLVTEEQFLAAGFAAIFMEERIPHVISAAIEVVEEVFEVFTIKCNMLEVCGQDTLVA